MPLTEVPVSWPNFKASPWLIPRTREKGTVSGGYKKVPKQQSLLSKTHHTSQKLPREDSESLWFLLRKRLELLWQKHYISPGHGSPEGVHHQCHHKHPIPLLFLEAVAGKNIVGTELSWLPVLLVDYSHLFPSSTKCANHKNISQWLPCYNPPSSNKPNVDQN